VSPFDDGLNPIRHEILNGRSILAYDGTGDGSSVEAIVLEAARLCGREGDVRVVHVGAFARSFTERGSRRLGVGSLPDPEDFAFVTEDLVALEPFVPAAPFPPPGVPEGRTHRHLAELLSDDVAMADLPPFDPDEAMDGRHLVVVVGGGGFERCHAYFTWLVFEAVGRAREENRSEPMAFLAKGVKSYDFGFGKLLHWNCLPAVGPEGVATCGEAGMVDRAIGPDLYDVLRWRALKAPHEILLSGDGHVHIADARRMVLARAMRSSTRPEATAVEIAEIADGHVRSLCFSGVESDLPVRADDVMGELCRTAWRCGLAVLSGPAVRLFGMGGQPVHRAVLGLLAEDGRDGGANVSALVRDRVDPALAAAASCVAFPEAVVRRVDRDPERRTFRRDFVVTFPALSEAILDPAVLACVDGGREAIPTLAAHLSTTPAIVRRLVGREAVPGWSGAYPVGAFLEAFGHDNLPPQGDNRAWRAFLMCCRMAASPLHRTGTVPPAMLAGLLLGVSAPDWPARLERLKATEIPGEDVVDYICAFARLMDNAGCERPTYNKAFRLLSRHGSLLALMRASQAWHDEPVRQLDGSGPAPDATWPVPFAPVDLADGWRAMAIGSQAGLRDEGRSTPDRDGLPGLSHCVATYGTACATGQSVIVSLRRLDEGEEVRDSTVELSRSETGDWRMGGAMFRMVQHRGHRNAPPSPAAEARVRMLRAALDAGRVRIDHEALEPRQAVRRGQLPVMPDVYLAGWDPILPDVLRGLGLEGFRAKVAAMLEEDGEA
jgi:hypothetical protein